MPIKADLHLHTCHSDGTWTVPVLLEKLREAGITVFSVTDHNMVSAHDEVRALLKSDLRFIPGVEISCTEGGTEYHLTCYGNLADNARMLELCKRNYATMRAYNRDIVAYTSASAGLDLLDDYDSYSYDRTRGGWSSLNFLIDKGLISGLADFSALFTGKVKRPTFVSPPELIDAAKSAGTILVFLAHPPAYFRNDILPLDILDRWRDFGIDGIECFNPYFSDQSKCAYYLDYCTANRLLVSGGSDCHGDFVARKLGNPVFTSDDISFEAFSELAVSGWKQE